MAFDNTHAAHGLLAYKLDHPDASISTLYVAWVAGITEVFGRVYFWKANFPVTGFLLAGGFGININSATVKAAVGIQHNGFIYIQDSVGGKGTGVVAYTFADWNRIDFHFISGAGNAFLEAKLFKAPNKDGTTPDDVISTSIGNTGGGFSNMAYGYPDGVSGTIQQGPTWIDDLEWNICQYPTPGASC